MEPDIILIDCGDYFLINFLSQHAKLWACEHVSLDAQWRGAMLQMKKENFDHFEFAMFNADLEFVERDETWQ